MAIKEASTDLATVHITDSIGFLRDLDSDGEAGRSFRDKDGRRGSAALIIGFRSRISREWRLAPISDRILMK